jgi:hypothetical protein
LGRDGQHARQKEADFEPRLNELRHRPGGLERLGHRSQTRGTIDADRLADLGDVIVEYPQFLVIASLPEDDWTVDDDYTRASDI